MVLLRMEERDIKILDKLNEILNRLDKIEQDIQYLKNGSDTMTEHVTFVDNVYESIKTPFYFIINKIKTIEHIPEKPKSLTE